MWALGTQPSALLEAASPSQAQAERRGVTIRVPAGWPPGQSSPGCPWQVAWLRGRGARGETAPPPREARFPRRSPGTLLIHVITTISGSGDDQGLALCSSSPSSPSPVASPELRGDFSLI